MRAKRDVNYYATAAGPGTLQFRVVDSVPEPTGIEHVAVAADDVDTTVEKSDGYTVHLLEEL